MTKASRPRTRRPPGGTQPPHLHPPYRSSIDRAPRHALVPLPSTPSEATGPAFDADVAGLLDCDLTKQRAAPPLGERIVVSGRVLDEYGRAVPRTLIEVWQANAAGRYEHPSDRHDAPLDPNFGGSGRMLTGADGGYRLVTIRPGAYPWRNHDNAWRPAHIHFSVFGPSFASRLVTQMYFPGDPLLERDPIFNCTADESARRRLIARFDWPTTVPEHALGYRFDIVVSGPQATPSKAEPRLVATTWQTVGPFFSVGLGWPKWDDLAPGGPAGERVTISGRVIDGHGQGVPDALIETWAPSLGRPGRVPTDGHGRFRFTTPKPIPSATADGTLPAPHLAVSVFARGLMRRLVTRVYLPDEPANGTDPVLAGVEPSRRPTLVARRIGAHALEWNVVLQGDGETVFFDC